MLRLLLEFFPLFRSQPHAHLSLTMVETSVLALRACAPLSVRAPRSPVLSVRAPRSPCVRPALHGEALPSGRSGWKAGPRIVRPALPEGSGCCAGPAVPLFIPGSFLFWPVLLEAWLRKLQNSRAGINPSGALRISTFSAWGLQTGLRANLAFPHSLSGVSYLRVSPLYSSRDCRLGTRCPRSRRTGLSR